MARKLTITISDFGHDAMQENPSGEVSTILRSVADAIERQGIQSGASETVLRDSNGNRVGKLVSK